MLLRSEVTLDQAGWRPEKFHCDARHRREARLSLSFLPIRDDPVREQVLGGSAAGKQFDRKARIGCCGP
jgi:hypothetical protein